MQGFGNDYVQKLTEKEITGNEGFKEYVICVLIKGVASFGGHV